jgi:hypothetical protein
MMTKEEIVGFWPNVEKDIGQCPHVLRFLGKLMRNKTITSPEKLRIIEMVLARERNGFEEEMCDFFYIAMTNLKKS